MQEEQKELYFYTKDKFSKQLSRISPTCVSPLIATRKVVKTAIHQYIKDHCSKETKPEQIFSNEDFKEVSNKIYNEIMEGDIF